MLTPGFYRSSLERTYGPFVRYLLVCGFDHATRSDRLESVKLPSGKRREFTEPSSGLQVYSTKDRCGCTAERAATNQLLGRRSGRTPGDGAGPGRTGVDTRQQERLSQCRVITVTNVAPSCRKRGQDLPGHTVPTPLTDLRVVHTGCSALRHGVLRYAAKTMQHAARCRNATHSV